MLQCIVILGRTIGCKRASENAYCRWVSRLSLGAMLSIRNERMGGRAFDQRHDWFFLSNSAPPRLAACQEPAQCRQVHDKHARDDTGALHLPCETRKHCPPDCCSGRCRAAILIVIESRMRLEHMVRPYQDTLTLRTTDV